LKIIILTTDTNHHKFFINFISNYFPFYAVIFETTGIQPKFKTKSLFFEKEKKYEINKFFKFKKANYPKIQTHKFKNINELKSYKLIRKINPDLCILFGTRKVEKNIVQLLKNKLINVHRGITQNYRGLDSEFWAIKENKFDQIGVTIHYVTNELDRGDILEQKLLVLKKNMKIHQLKYYTTLIATELCLQILFKIKNNLIIRKKFIKKGKYYSFMTSLDKNKLEKKFNKFCKILKYEQL